ncbi:DUF6438 domain-containing protein [uncultured Sphingomonas sp.]|uniref:DUF6438 domain-containing protein n=1 Tax=uncultured Sphingomonas sp. TaxID=158754 RepID=UPI0035CABB26
MTVPRQGAPNCVSCPSYSITLGPDGQGVFSGERNTAVTGDYRFQATAQQVATFSHRIRPSRAGASTDLTFSQLCSTDARKYDTVSVTWMTADERPATLRFNRACSIRLHRKTADALLSAPSLLPIADLIGHR